MHEDGPNGARGRNAWLAAMALVILAGVAVPYGVLGGGFATALFWLGFGLVVAGLIVVAVLRWRD